MGDRRRNALILLIVLGLLAASLVVIASKPTRLGLDLKGGVQLIYQGRATAQAKVDPESLSRAIDIMRKRVDQLGVAQPEIQTTGGKEISVGLPDVTNAQRAQQQVGKTAQLFFYDWEPNVIGPSGNPEPTEAHVTGGTQPASAEAGLPEYEAVKRALKRKAIIRKNATTYSTGCTPAQVGGCIYGQWYLIDETTKKVLRGPEDTEGNLYGDNQKLPAKDKIKAVRVNPGTVLAQAQPITGKNGKVTQPSPESWYVLNDDPVLTGNDIKNPRQGFDEQSSGQPNVTFEFTSGGRKTFEHVTRQIAERGQSRQLPGVPKAAALQHFAVVLDNQVITAPSIDYTQYPEGIDASTGSQISGGFTLNSATNLADELQSGALPIKLELISQSQVSATLGKTALKEGLIAGLIGFAIVCLFLLVFYRVLGVIAVGGLLIYGIYYFALIKLIPITLTLPGIAGLILTIGIAADANIVIFERVKEEIRAGRSIPAGIATGYKRGFAAIVDANVVTFMTAFILFALATAEVQGFAFTLGIGTLLTLFTAVLATQAALGAMGRSRAVSHPALLGAGRSRRKWTFDFMGSSRWFFSLSGCILAIGALAIGGKGINFGIDFKSGTRIETAFVKAVSENQVQSAMSEAGYPNAQIQKISSSSIGGQGYQISLKKLKPEEVQKVKSKLDTKFGSGPQSPGTKNFSNTSIGPTFGQTVAKSAVIAIIASLLVISIYIALRFEWKYAVPVLIALMHDLLITSGVYALTGREVTTATVAALLTILGYSMYDTIIVFDRVRENVPRMPRAAFSQIVNRSMSEVLTRSLATSFCTLLPVAAILLFGGATLKDFAFAIMIGIASGAYSSIFIASPVLTHWKEREGVYRNRRARIERDLGYVPAYALATGETPVDVEPPAKKRRGGPTLTEEPGDQLSREEFDELVRDIEPEISEQPAGASTSSRTAGLGARAGLRRGRSNGAPKADVEPASAAEPPQRDSSADLEPEDLVMKEPPKPRRQRRPKNRRHGRAR
ncbi:MAG TPA: protein translocase subunit SecD [Solirubrobacteraceae bacterium]|jgi:SecD/SecF fusion protein|nr:protein translocase subunit SecD [Solirubrobacteraceae bacterium]